MLEVDNRGHDWHILFELQVMIPRPLIVSEEVAGIARLGNYFHLDTQLGKVFSLVHVFHVVKRCHENRDQPLVLRRMHFRSKEMILFKVTVLREYYREWK